MDAIELLKRDHRKVEDLFMRFRDGGGVSGAVKRLTGNAGSPRQHRTIAERICKELETHARIEETTFYPAIRALDDSRIRSLVDESLGEHATIKERVQAVRAALGVENELGDRVADLEDCVTHHVREEEGELFPLVEDHMQSAARNRLGQALAARKRAASPRARKPARRPAPARGRRGRATAARRHKTKTAASSRKKARGGRRR